MNNHKSILLVDDDKDDQQFFKEALEEVEPGAHCTIANNGLEALEKLDKEPAPSIIFLDLNMPVMNGYELLTILKEKKQTKIPVVILTTSNDPAEKYQTLKMGANFFLTKASSFAGIKSQLLGMLERNFDLAC